MTHWSAEAKKLLERALLEAGRKAAGEGADADEVIGDLRLRVEQELAATAVEVVATDDVASVLTKLGVPTPAAEEATPATAKPAEPPVKPAKKHTGCLLTAGMFLSWFVPCVALAWEVLAKLTDIELSCRILFFDPLPSWFHALLIATVPVVNFAGWRQVCGSAWPARYRPVLRVLWGVALAVSLWYGIRFVAVLPIALIGLVAIIYFGLGLLALLPLAPYIGLGGLLAHHQRFDEPGQGRGKLAGFTGATLALLAMLASSFATAHGLRLAASEEPAEQVRGIQFLRQWGDRSLLADRCFGASRSEFGFGDLMDPLRAIGHTPDELQRIFYRAYGQPFYMTSAAGKRNGLRGERSRVDVAFDRGQGGDNVGQGVSGLSLAASRIDGQVEPALASAYLEWTLEFANSASVEREARAQIALPPGGVVSRLTLWVNGEEREAAFSGKSQVKAAYQKVVQARRDPVLVTSCGEDRVMMQCFPVPRDGGTMKVRLGITVPLDLLSAESASLRLPVFLERNFNLLRLAHNDVWIEGAADLRADGADWIAATNKAGAVALHGSLAPATVLEGIAPLRMKREAGSSFVCPDPIVKTQTIVTQFAVHTAAPPARIVFALDASVGMKEPLMKALAALPARWPGAEIAWVAAANEAVASSSPRPWDDGALDDVGRFMGGLAFGGGQDNAPALLKAWDLAAARPHSLVVWLHGPGQELISSADALRQRMERSPGGPRVHDIQIGAGPHRLVEQLESLSGYRGEGVVAEASGVLKDWCASRVAGLSYDVVRTRVEESPPGAVRVDSPHAARLWAWTEVQTLLDRHVPVETEKAAQLAAQYYLVTPVSGAVVLETAQQFAEAGLSPMSASVATVVVPEPATVLMALFGAAVLGLRVWRRRRRS